MERSHNEKIKLPERSGNQKFLILKVPELLNFVSESFIKRPEMLRVPNCLFY